MIIPWSAMLGLLKLADAVLVDGDAAKFSLYQHDSDNYREIHVVTVVDDDGCYGDYVFRKEANETVTVNNDSFDLYDSSVGFCKITPLFKTNLEKRLEA